MTSSCNENTNRRLDVHDLEIFYRKTHPTDEASPSLPVMSCTTSRQRLTP